MTTIETRTGSRSEAAIGVAEEFFAAYRRHDTGAMVRLCTPTAGFHYVPFEMWGRQRVLRGAGKVATIGKPLWSGLIAAFPDLTNEIRSITADEQGDVALEVVVSGTQAGPWGTLTPRGQRFSEPHLFVLHVDETGRIDDVVAYWDNASIFRQLGHLEVD